MLVSKHEEESVSESDFRNTCLVVIFQEVILLDVQHPGMLDEVTVYSQSDILLACIIPYV
jgi:hypothetical protein